MQETADELRISDWSSDVCSSDLSFVSAFELDSPTQDMTSAERLDRTNQAVEILLHHVTISPVRTSSLVDVSFASPSPQLSARQIGRASCRERVCKYV